MKPESSRYRKSAGICGVCVRAPVCLLAQASDLPLVQCGMFEPCEGSSLLARTSVIEESGPTTGRDRFRGLCSDCELRYDCGAIKPDSGVWHCKHYR